MSSSITSSKASIFRAIVNARRSAKRFQTNREVPTDTLKDILTSTLRSPSSFNLQPTQIVLVQDQRIKDALAQHSMLGVGNQYRTRDCSALAVFCSDLEASDRIPRIMEMEKDWGKRHPNYMAIMPISTAFLLGEGHAATFIKQLTTGVLSNVTTQPMPQIDSVQAWSYKNTALAVQSFMLAATSHDLATCVMEGLDSRRAKQILRIPDRYDIPMVIAVGYEYQGEDDKEDDDDSGQLTPRLGLDEIVFQDSFGVPWTDDDGDEEPANATA